MNILFIAYGDQRTNSWNHISGFASGLHELGFACAVALPSHAAVAPPAGLGPHFNLCSHEDVARARFPFPDGAPPALVHAWTPRHNVLCVVLRIQARLAFPARLIVHLEDNEQHLVASTSGTSFEEISRWSDRRLAPLLRKNLVHPVRHRLLLAAADGATLITSSLGDFVPTGVPARTLRPVLDLALFSPRPPDPAKRAALGLRPGEKIIVYPGGANLTNAAELHTLHTAVALLARDGVPVRLLRTGPPAPWFWRSLSPDERAVCIDLGYVSRMELPDLLSLADVLVQPGASGPFNDYRLPSKLPEFLACGRPVLLPAANLALEMRDGREALFLRRGSPEEIAARCRELFDDPTRADALAHAAREFALTHFDPARALSNLADFYREIIRRPPRIDWRRLRRRFTDEAALIAQHVDSQSDLRALALARLRRRPLRRVLGALLPLRRIAL